jgi:hypothetical protein
MHFTGQEAHLESSGYDFIKRARQHLEKPDMRSSHEFKPPRWNLCQDDQESYVDQIIMVKSGWSGLYKKANWSDKVIGHIADSAPTLVWPLTHTGQTGQTKVLKMPIGLHHCVDLVETIEMHMWNVQFGVQMRELWSWQEPALLLTGLTGGARRPHRCPRSNPS